MTVGGGICRLPWPRKLRVSGPCGAVLLTRGRQHGNLSNRGLDALVGRNDVAAQALRRRGWSISAIARHLGYDRKTIRAYLSGERPPIRGLSESATGPSFSQSQQAKRSLIRH